MSDVPDEAHAPNSPPPNTKFAHRVTVTQRRTTLQKRATYVTPTPQNRRYNPARAQKRKVELASLPDADDILIGDEGASYQDPNDPPMINAVPHRPETLATLDQAATPAKQEPWLRFSDEPTRQWRAFVAYRDLGERRSFEKAAEIAGEHTTVIVQWSQKWQWHWRVECFDRYVARVAANQVATEHAEMLKRHASISMLLQEKALLRLKTMDAGELTPREALWFLREAVNIERASRAQPIEIMPTEVEDANNAAAADESWMTDVFSILVESGALPADADLSAASGIIDAEAHEVHTAPSNT